jgi:hypothetical protein
MTPKNRSFVDQSPVIQGEGASVPYTIALSDEDGGSVTITTTGGSVEIYKNGSGSDLSGSLTSGSASASGNEYTTPVITGLTGGNFYICSFYATINSSVDLVGKLKIVCPRNKDDQ